MRFRVPTHSTHAMSPLCVAAPVRVFACTNRDSRSAAKPKPTAPPPGQIPDIPRRAVSVALATCVSLVLVTSASPSLPFALAIPQTSECATNSCDDKDYSGLDLTKEYYTKGSVKRAKFVGSNLAGVTLFGADLTDADFTGADLTNANIGQCNLSGTIFTNANLSGAIVSGANMDTVGNIDGSDW